jgi:porin
LEAWFVNDTWMPYLRPGYTDNGTAMLAASVSAGSDYYFKQSKDLIGFSLNRERPPDSGLDDQHTAKLLYRL